MIGIQDRRLTRRLFGMSQHAEPRVEPSLATRTILAGQETAAEWRPQRRSQPQCLDHRQKLAISRALREAVFDLDTGDRLPSA